MTSSSASRKRNTPPAYSALFSSCTFIKKVQLLSQEGTVIVSSLFCIHQVKHTVMRIHVECSPLFPIMEAVPVCSEPFHQYLIFVRQETVQCDGHNNLYFCHTSAIKNKSMKPMLISNRGSDKAQHRNSHGLTL